VSARCGIVLHPAGHTRSPAMHNAAYAALGLDAVFVAFDVAPEQLGAAVAGARALGIRQLAVSITPPTFSTTSSFFFCAWKAAATSASSAFSAAASSKSSSRLRSRNSPELRPSVTTARSDSRSASCWGQERRLWSEEF